MKQLQWLILILILIFSLCVRIDYPAHMGLSDEQLEDIKDKNGGIYPYQYDSYAFVAATKGLGYNDLWGWHFHAVKRLLPQGSNTIFFLKILCMIYFSLTLVFFYFFLKIHIQDFWIPFWGVFLLGTNITFLNNSYWGFLDRNLINHFFIVVMLFFISLVVKRKKIIYGLLFLGATFLFRQTWAGWFPIFIISIFSASGWLLIAKFPNYRLKHIVLISGSFFASWALLHFFGRFIAIYAGFGGQNLTKYAYISEIQPPILNLFFPVAMAIMGLHLIFCLLFKNRKKFTFYLAVSWYYPLAFVALRAERNIFYFIMPAIFSVCLLLDNFELRKDIIMITISILSYAFVIIYCLTNTFVPVMDDSIHDSMYWARNNLDEDTILLSHWDQGIMYYVYSGLQVPFKSVIPSNKFMYRILLSNETRSKNLLQKYDKYVLVVNNKDLEKNKSMQQYSNMTMTDESLLYKMIYKRDDITFFEVLKCSNTSFKEVCIWGEKIGMGR